MESVTLQWLGAGSGLNLALGNTSFFVRGAGERLLLVDCGFTVPQKLIEHGILERVTDILITHLHADHVGGLETFAFFHHFVLKNRGEARPTLHLPTEELALSLWNDSLKAGMQYGMDENGQPFTSTLETYFKVSIGLRVEVPGFPAVTFVPTPHVPRMPNFAVRFDNGIYYSADSTDIPPQDAELIFQDAQFGPASSAAIHTAYETLRNELSDDVRAKTWLVHIGAGHEGVSPVADGFAGVVQTGQIFEHP